MLNKFQNEDCCSIHIAYKYYECYIDLLKIIKETYKLTVFILKEMKDIELLKEKIQNYFKSKKGVIAVYLFGSHAKGKEYQSSDIDIGILLDRNHQEYKKTLINNSIVELGRVLKKDIHPVILNSAGEELLRQIFLNGKCLLINNPEELSRFKMVMFSRIADFAYYRNKMQSGLIKKVMKG